MCMYVYTNIHVHCAQTRVSVQVCICRYCMGVKAHTGLLLRRRQQMSLLTLKRPVRLWIARPALVSFWNAVLVRLGV